MLHSGLEKAHWGSGQLLEEIYLNLFSLCFVIVYMIYLITFMMTIILI